MSSSISALNGKAYQGTVSVTEQGLRGMITVRGDLDAASIRNAATGVTGVDYPSQEECNCVGDQGIAWMSPDELLVMVAYDKVYDAIASIEKTLDGSHSLVANVSDARAVIRIEGAGVRDVMAKLSPVDLSEDRFVPGQFRRTRLAQIPAAFWMRDSKTVELICFRSVAGYAFDVLSRAALPGTEVGYL